MVPQWTVWIWGRRPLVTLLRAVMLGLMFYALGRFVCQPVHVAGRSMEPTIHDGSWRLGNLLKFHNRNPQRGEVVMITMAGWHAFYLKRILGLPGETIAFQKGMLLVNGRVVAEPYRKTFSAWTMAPICIPPDEYYVAGDNRVMPQSAHMAGLTRRGDIAGGLLW